MSNYVRRRRVCLKDRCGGKITTLEVKHPGAMIGLSDAVVVPRERLRGFCQSLAMLIDPEHAGDDD